MSHKLYLTQLGQQKLAELATVGTGQALRLTDFAVGSGRDVDFSKRLDRQILVAKKYQAHVQDVVNIAPNQYEISCVIPADVGGFTIREVGLFADNILMWVGSLPEVQKPTLESLSAVDYRIKCIVTIDNTDVRLVVDGNVVTATKKWVLDTIGDNLQAEITKILAEIETLKNRPIIPVGGLFATTKHYANGEAVTADLGYGKWQRALIGRTGVGFDPNASDWTGTMGRKYGANEHTLTVAEMPSHTHDFSDSNLRNKGGFWEGDQSGGVRLNDGKPITNLVIGNTGGNQAHNNVQKSEVIAYWVRMPDNAFVFESFDVTLTINLDRGTATTSDDRVSYSNAISAGGDPDILTRGFEFILNKGLLKSAHYDYTTDSYLAHVSDTIIAQSAEALKQSIHLTKANTQAELNNKSVVMIDRDKLVFRGDYRVDLTPDRVSNHRQWREDALSSASANYNNGRISVYVPANTRGTLVIHTKIYVYEQFKEKI